MVVTKHTTHRSTIAEQRKALQAKIFKNIDKVCDTVDSISPLACYLNVTADDKCTAQTIADMFSAFTYQIGKLGLAIEYDTKNELGPEAMSFRAAMRTGTIFYFQDLESLKDVISHDGADLIKKTRAVSDEILQLIEDVYDYATKYATTSAISRSVMEDIYKELKSLAVSILECEGMIRLALGDTDDGTFM
ncbi:MAG: hypothetical protein M1569_03810 [Candidatus Marsarchaeota archaeon]|nr:hypothetical protein [Candidatus Marsarchaeota archaeon]MCL5413499.1 hypothetical protein [Candidatus Marsarchaeota archaeon]